MNWIKLRKKYFKECVSERISIDIFGNENKDLAVCVHPHDLFEWFKREIKNYEKTTSIRNLGHVPENDIPKIS
jgi:hypothetical protein